MEIGDIPMASNFRENGPERKPRCKHIALEVWDCLQHYDTARLRKLCSGVLDAEKRDVIGRKKPKRGNGQRRWI